MAGWQAQLDSGAQRALGRRLSDAERTAFGKYMDLLLKWQRVQRLVGSADPNWITTHLILDSLLFLRVVPASCRRLLDLGSGAGFPGVPVAIVRPDADITLLEARQRRASFLAAVVREVPLPNARVRAERAEAVRDELAGSFDAVVMRCAGGVSEVAPLAVDLVRPGGMVVVSGPPRSAEIAYGRWVETEGVDPRAARRFLVIDRPGV